MVTLVLMILSIAAGAFLADRLAFFKEHQIRQGILFGLLAIIANTFSVDVYGMGISVGLIDAPPMVAGLMFGSMAGVVAGGIAAVGRALTPLWGVGVSTWLVCSVATLLVSCYAALFRNLVFDCRRPHIVPAVIAVAFGEVLHLAFFFLCNMSNFTISCEVIYSSAEPMIFGSATAMALSWLVCYRRGVGRVEDELHMPYRSFLIFGIAFIFLARFAMTGAERRVGEELTVAIKNFDEEMSKKIEMFMFRCSHHILNTVGDPRTCTTEALQKGAREHGMDQANIVLLDEERVVASSREEFINAPFLRSNPHTGEFFQLQKPGEKVVAQKFRYDTISPKEYNRYLGIPFPGQKYILEVAYSFKRMERELEFIFLPSIADAPVYHTGYFLVIDKAGRIINTVRNHHEVTGKKIEEIGLSQRVLGLSEKNVTFVRLFGDVSCCMVDRRIGNLFVLAVLPLKDVYWTTLRLIFICGIALFGLSLFFRWVMVKALRSQRQLDQMRQEQEAQKNRELMLASSVQISELKTDPADSDRYAVNAFVRPAREVGGDSYDYFEQPGGKVVFGIADVSGKGIAAAIFCMKVRTTLELLGMQEKSVEEFMETTNNILCKKNEAMLFVTCWAGVFDPVTRELEYVCAGHNPPFLVKKNGTAEMLDCRKMLPLGVKADYQYHIQKLRLEPGDQLFIYTDGVTEAMNQEHQLYGVPRLQSVLKKYGQENTDLIDQVLHSVEEFADGAEQSDDITMVNLRVK